jgi:hypothetical protein
MKDFINLCHFVGIPREIVQGFTDDIRREYVLRRTKEEVARYNKRLELPPCDFQNTEMEMYPEEKELYNEVFENCQDVVRSVLASENRGAHQMALIECLLRSRQVMTWPQLYLNGMANKEETDTVKWTGRSRKMETLIASIKSHPTEKTLVFTQFMGEMDHIQELLAGEKITTFRIDGSVVKDDREARIKGFKAGPFPSVFLIQIKAGGVGLNLQEATRVYITTPAWNPATELQAIGRAHRTGQTRKVVIRRLIYTGYEGVIGSDGNVSGELPSVEQSIMQLQESKAKVCAEVLNDPKLATQVPNAPKSPTRTIHALRKIFNV